MTGADPRLSVPPSGHDPVVRVEMLRKVASSLREWSTIERRVVNITGVPVRRRALASWIASQVLDVTFADASALESGTGLLPVADWCEGFGPRVLVRWPVPGAPARGCGSVGAGVCCLDFLSADRNPPVRGRVAPWTVDRLELVSCACGRAGEPRTRCVHAQDGSVSLLRADQIRVLNLLSAAATPALTRYH